MGMPTELEATLIFQMKAKKITGYVREHKFHHKRRFKFDVAFVEEKVAVECEGGIFTRQAHGSITGILRDIEKYNLATINGWKVLRYHSKLAQNPHEFLDGLITLLEKSRDRMRKKSKK